MWEELKLDKVIEKIYSRLRKNNLVETKRDKKQTNYELSEDVTNDGVVTNIDDCNIGNEKIDSADKTLMEEQNVGILLVALDRAHCHKQY